MRSQEQLIHIKDDGLVVFGTHVQGIECKRHTAVEDLEIRHLGIEWLADRLVQRQGNLVGIQRACCQVRHVHLISGDAGKRKVKAADVESRLVRLEAHRLHTFHQQHVLDGQGGPIAGTACRLYVDRGRDLDAVDV